MKPSDDLKNRLDWIDFIERLKRREPFDTHFYSVQSYYNVKVMVSMGNGAFEGMERYKYAS